MTSDSTEDTFEGLIGRAVTDPDSFAELYSRYSREVFGYIFHDLWYKKVGNKEDAEDITIIVWEKVFTNLKSLRNRTEAGFHSWLYTIIKSCINDYHRRVESRPKVHEEVDVYALEIKDRSLLTPDEEYEVKESFIRISKCLKQLPERQAEMVNLRYLKGLDNKEIAIIVGISEKTVASNLSRGLEKLKELMQ